MKDENNKSENRLPAARNIKNLKSFLEKRIKYKKINIVNTINK